MASAKKKPAPKKKAPAVSRADFNALADEVRHMKVVLNRRLNFDISTEPEDIVVPEADES